MTKSRSSLTKQVGDDKLSRLEETIAKLASAVEGSTSMISKVAERVDGLEEKVKESGKIPFVKSAEDRLDIMKQVTKAGDIAESSRVQDFLNPRGADSGFQADDIVKLSENADVAFRTYRLDANGEPVKKGIEGEQALGVVLSYMYTRRDGQRKYKVNFPKFGKSGFLERELILVKAA